MGPHSAEQAHNIWDMVQDALPVGHHHHDADHLDLLNNEVKQENVTLILYYIKGTQMGSLLVLVSPCLENVNVTCKIVSFL